MKIAILGTTPMTAECIMEFYKNQWEIAAVISLTEGNKPLNSVDLKSLSQKCGAIYYETNDLNDGKTELFLQKLELDYIFSTWPYIIKDNILRVPKYYVIGSHPTQLPFNRGRHPLHWLISMGIRESDLSLFVMNEGIDSGNLLVQEKYSCICDFGIKDVYDNMMNACRTAINKLCGILEKNPSFEGRKQDSSVANYWRKRNLFDVIIDFRMQALDIERLVKSFNRPYECAVLVYKTQMIRISNAAVISYTGSEEELQRIEPGKIIWKKDYNICVKAADQLVRLDIEQNNTFSRLQPGKYIFPAAKYMIEEPELYKKLLPYVKQN